MEICSRKRSIARKPASRHWSLASRARWLSWPEFAWPLRSTWFLKTAGNFRDTIYITRWRAKSVCLQIGRTRGYAWPQTRRPHTWRTNARARARVRVTGYPLRNAYLYNINFRRQPHCRNPMRGRFFAIWLPRRQTNVLGCLLYHTPTRATKDTSRRRLHCTGWCLFIRQMKFSLSATFV